MEDFTENLKEKNQVGVRTKIQDGRLRMTNFDCVKNKIWCTNNFRSEIVSNFHKQLLKMASNIQ